jgi:hypothetical protein
MSIEVKANDKESGLRKVEYHTWICGAAVPVVNGNNHLTSNSSKCVIDGQ